MNTILLTLLLFTASDDPRAAVLGDWHGTSICTKEAGPACHDETVVYHVTPGNDADVVLLQANKIIDGKEEDMGTLEFHLDFAAHRMVAEFHSRRSSRWTFEWNGDVMKGTAVLLESGAIGRNVNVKR